MIQQVSSNAFHSDGDAGLKTSVRLGFAFNGAVGSNTIKYDKTEYAPMNQPPSWIERFKCKVLIYVIFLITQNGGEGGWGPIPINMTKSAGNAAMRPPSWIEFVTR